MCPACKANVDIDLFFLLKSNLSSKHHHQTLLLCQKLSSSIFQLSLLVTPNEEFKTKN